MRSVGTLKLREQRVRGIKRIEIVYFELMSIDAFYKHRLVVVGQ